MTRRLLLAPLALAVALASADDIWTVQMIDPNGDARGRPDAAQLSFRYDRAADVLWFRIAVYGRPDPAAFGIRLAIDTDRIVTAQVPVVTAIRGRSPSWRFRGKRVSSRSVIGFGWQAATEGIRT